MSYSSFPRRVAEFLGEEKLPFSLGIYKWDILFIRQTPWASLDQTSQMSYGEGPFKIPLHCGQLLL